MCVNRKKNSLVGVVERGGNLSTQHERQPLDAVKVCVLDGHHPSVGKDLLWEVVDELQGVVTGRGREERQG